MDKDKVIRMVALLTQGLNVDELNELTNLLLEDRIDWYEKQVKNLTIPDVGLSLPNYGVKITTEGLMNGNWLMKIKGIKDADLYNTEVAILDLFGRKKRGQRSLTTG